MLQQQWCRNCLSPCAFAGVVALITAPTCHLEQALSAGHDLGGDKVHMMSGLVFTSGLRQMRMVQMSNAAATNLPNVYPSSMMLLLN